MDNFSEVNSNPNHIQKKIHQLFFKNQMIRTASMQKFDYIFANIEDVLPEQVLNIVDTKLI